jgi:hypothetical protein
MMSLSFLRRALLADAVISGATGVLLVAAAGLADELLGLPASLLRFAGLALFPFVAVVFWLAARETPPQAGVVAVIAANILWAACSILLLFTGWIAPTGLGVAFVVAQALVVAVFAELQITGLRRPSASVGALA